MKRTILAALTGGALALTGCSSTPAAAPAAAPAQAEDQGAVAEKADPEAEQEELRDAAAQQLGEAYDKLVTAYNEGVENGDDVMEADPSASLDGFAQQRDALYEFDGAVRDIEFPDELVPDVNEYLEALGEHIAVLDEINAAETVGDLDTLYQGKLRDARDTEVAALDPLLQELGINLEEEEEEAPTIGGGRGSSSGGEEGESTPGNGGEVITDAKAVSDTLREAVSFSSGMVETQIGAFPENWIPHTKRWTFAGTAYEPDPETIIGNTIIAHKDGSGSYIVLAIEDTEGRCEALTLRYDADDKPLAVGGKSVDGECTYENALTTLGY